MEIETQTTGLQGPRTVPPHNADTSAESTAQLSPEHATTPALPRSVLADFYRSWGGKRCRSLLGGSEATGRTFKDAYVRVKAACAKVGPEHLYTARELYGPAKWDAQSIGYQRCIGMFVAFLAECDELAPLIRHVTPSGSGTHLYVMRLQQALVDTRTGEVVATRVVEARSKPARRRKHR